jgi:hypothetical protein
LFPWRPPGRTKWIKIGLGTSSSRNKRKLTGCRRRDTDRRWKLRSSGRHGSLFSTMCTSRPQPDILRENMMHINMPFVTQWDAYLCTRNYLMQTTRHSPKNLDSWLSLYRQQASTDQPSPSHQTKFGGRQDSTPVDVTVWAFRSPTQDKTRSIQYMARSEVNAFQGSHPPQSALLVFRTLWSGARMARWSSRWYPCHTQ